jgi:predicted enzyme related to lactoylglutathione lyase
MKVLKILSRLYVNDLDASIAFYEALTGEKCAVRFAYKEKDLDLAQIGSLLLIAGNDQALEPFRTTTITILVDALTEFREFLLKNGAVIIRDITKVPTGFNIAIKHKDGTIAEYVEFAKP